MRKAYTEEDLVALIDQYKTRKNYAIHCASNPEYVEASLADIDRQIEALTKRRQTITDAIEKTDELIAHCDAKMASFRKMLAFVRKHGSVGKLLELKRKAAALQQDLER